MSLDADKAVVQIDFADYYAIVSEDEVQAAHFSYDQITVFTVCVWTSTKTQSFAVISDDLSHDKYSVWTFLRTIDNITMKMNEQRLNKFHIFSDGCAA